MPEITLPYNWTPRPYQRKLWDYLENGGKRAYEVAHRRWGKDDVCLNWTATALTEHPATYWHMLPEASQARKAIWDAINPHTGKRRIDEAFPKEIRSSTRENDMMIKFKNGATWQVLGSDNYDSLVGSPPKGIVFSEWALANPQAWTYMRPILAENGGWALFITTPRGRNHAQRMLTMAEGQEHWFTEVSTVDQTKAIPDAVLAQERIELIGEFGDDEGEAKFRQEYYCDFNAAVVGSYYGKIMNEMESEGRITKVPYDEAFEVNTIWDIGGDGTSILFHQEVGREHRIIDCYEAQKSELADEVKMLKTKPYNYGLHILPHDAGHDSVRTGMTMEKQLNQMGLKSTIVLPNQEIDPGIQLAKQLLKRLVIDKEKCAGAVDAWREYHRKWSDERKVFSQTPVHDWSSHTSDALRYLAVWLATKKSPVVKAPEIVYNYGSEQGWMG